MDVDDAGGLRVWAERRLPGGYLVVALVLTGMLCVLTAPFASPDEEHHAARAISLSHGEWMARAGAGEYGAEIDANALRVMDGMDTARMAWEGGAGNFLDRRHGTLTESVQGQYGGVRWAGKTAFAVFPNTAGYPPLLYLPAIVGWRAGEAAGLTIFNSLRLARVLCAFSAVALGWVALRVCPAGSRWLLAGLLLLPSALFLNASCSQDAVLLSVGGLVMAMVTRAVGERRAFTGWEMALFGGLLGLCGTARPPYLVLALLVFVPNVELRVRRGLRWVGPGLACSGVVLAGIWWRRAVASVGFDPAGWADPEKQIAFLRGHAVEGGWVVVKGTAAAGVDFVKRGLYVVGWNDLLAGHGAAVGLTACLGLLVMFAPGCPIRTWAGRGLIAVAVGGSLVGITLAEYVIWTPPGGHVVDGVQPRYWLPVMPLGMLLIRGLLDGAGWRPGRGRDWVVAWAAGVLGVIACTLPWMVAEAFYGEGVAQVLRLNLR